MEFTTPKGTVIGLKEYITGKDLLDFKRVIMSKMKQDGLDKKGAPAMNVDFALAIDQEVKMVELTVLSVNGEKENAIDKVFALESGEYQSVANYVKDVFFSKVTW